MAKALKRDHRVRILAAYLVRTYGMDRNEAIMMLLEAGLEEQMKFFAWISYVYSRKARRSKWALVTG